MISDPKNGNRCVVAQPRNATAQQTSQYTATDSATGAQRQSLKALAGAALMRNERRNDSATEAQKYAQQMGQKTPNFVANCCAPIGSKLGPSSAGNDIPSSNDEILNPGLPSELFTLAVRYCVEQYGDSVEQVGEMISHLMEQSECWPEWISFIHFRLGIPKEVRCIDCIHAVDTGENLGRCARKVKAPGAGGLWWMTDMHPCVQFSAAQEAK